MKAFTYEKATSPVGAEAEAASNPQAKSIAGGTNLLDLMKLEIETTTHLIDVNGLGFDKIEATREGGLRIGAPVRNTDLATDARIRRDNGYCRARLLRAPRDSCETWRPRWETSQSGRGAPTSTTPTNRLYFK